MNPKRLISVLCLLVIFVVCSKPLIQKTEIRGVWLTNVDSAVLDSRESIAEAMQFLADHNFNVVFPVVWNDAKTIYKSPLMDSLFNVEIDPRFKGRDPLAEVIDEAHSRGIKVIAWFEYGFSSSHEKNGGMILRKRRKWAARDVDGNLLKKNGFEWMNAYHPEVQEFVSSLVLEVVKNYNVDGVQGDDRLPAQPIEGGYSDYTQFLYMATHQGISSPKDPREPLWQRWRADRLNAFAKKLYEDVKSIKPEIIVSWAPSIYPWSYDEYLQDWPEWIKNGYADLVIPQNYRYSIDEYKNTLDDMVIDDPAISASSCIIIPGILMNVGDYIMEDDYLLKALEYNREKGYSGEVFFFYEGLRKNEDELAKKLVKTYYQEEALLPF